VSVASADGLVAALAARFPVTSREPRDGAFGEVAHVPPGLMALADGWGGATLGEGFYRFHTPRSGARATAMCAPLVPEDARHWAFAFDWNGCEICLDRDTEEIIVVDPGLGKWFNGEAGLNDWHDILAAEPQLLRVERYQRWRVLHPEIGALPFDRTIGLERPLFLGGVDDPDHLEMWSHDVYLAMFAQLFAKTEGLPPGTVVDASILEQVRRGMGL
jgi:hypothetical protein